MKFAICNLGCKVNNYESNWYAQQLSLKYEEVDFKEIADVYIINSCTVTNMAGSKTRQMFHQAKKRNPKACIVCVSCYSQMEYLSKPELFDDCDIVIGSTHKKELPICVDKWFENKQRIVLVEEFEKTNFEEMELKTFNQTRAYLKIQDGCNQFCSYCTIPLARGRERCLSGDRIIQYGKNLVASGHQEIVLTGIHTGRWHDENGNLTALIKRMLNEIEGLKRIRLSSIEMTEVSDELIALMSQDERVASHLHIPLQTGTDRLLKLNNRPYTTEQYYQKIQKIRSLIPDISISSDVIAGLPTESSQEAKATEEFIEKCELSFLHVFPYAKKEHTKDAEMKQQVDEQEKKHRVSCLTNLSSSLYNRYASKFVGQKLQVLFETKQDNVNRGHCSQYIVTEVISEKDLSHQLLEVVVDEVKDNTLIAHLV